MYLKEKAPVAEIIRSVAVAYLILCHEAVEARRVLVALYPLVGALVLAGAELGGALTEYHAIDTVLPAPALL